MTDPSRAPGRIDLRAIDDTALPVDGERVIRAALSRMAAIATSNGDVLTSLLIYSRPMLAAAAALVLIALGTLMFTPRPAQVDQPVNVLAAWAERSHVPTNGELLAAFQGYGR